MKPFDLEQFKAGKTAVTRDGRQARYLGALEGNTHSSIVAAVKDQNGREDGLFYRSNGAYLTGHNTFGCDLLFMAPEKKEGWIVVSRSRLHDKIGSREHAEKLASDFQKRFGNPDGYWKVVHITWEE